MRSKYTFSSIWLFLQTVFICLALYAGQEGFLGYGAEKMAIAVFLMYCGLFLPGRTVISNRYNKSLVFMIGALLLIVVISYFNSYSRTATLPYVERFVFLFAAVFLCFDTRYLSKLLDWLEAIGVAIAAAYIVTYPFMGADAGIYRDYNYTAQVVSFSIAFVIPKLFCGQRHFARQLLWLVIDIFAILLTGKRMLFVIPFVLFLIISVLAADRAKYQKIAGIVLCLSVALGFVALAVPSAMRSITRLLTTGEDTTFSSRVYFWEYAKMLWSKNKAFGIGFASYPAHIATGGVDLAKYHYIQAWCAHNIYYQMLAEIGTFGTVVFCSVFGVGILYTMYWLKRVQKAQLTDCTRIVMASLCCQLWFVIYGFTGNPLYLAGQLFGEVFGLILMSSVKNHIKRQAAVPLCGPDNVQGQPMKA